MERERVGSSEVDALHICDVLEKKRYYMLPNKA